MRRHLAVLLICALPLFVAPSGTATAQQTGIDRFVDLTFPVAGPSTFGDDYDQPRGGGARRHQATDIFAPKLALVFAATDGAICRITGVDEPEPSYGYQLRLCGQDGRIYHYVHLNNDNPGTDDGHGGPELAYAPGLRLGTPVQRGQWLGYVGDSGNAEDTPPHLHLSITDPDLHDPSIQSPPWEPDRLNPYHSLLDAQQRGDVPTPALQQGDRGPLVSLWQRLLGLVLDGDLAADGDFGPTTASATVLLQEAAGLAADGVVGNATWAATLALLQDGTTVVTAAVGAAPAAVPVDQVSTDGGHPEFGGRLLRLSEPFMRGPDVQRWQERLAALNVTGANDRLLVADGVFGPHTDAVTRAFQQARGLAVDGIVGPLSWAAAF